MTGDDAAARAAARARQGAGARYDADTAPQDDLLLARRATACFARRLNALEDAALDAASRQPGWTRRHVIAHVSYHARALAHLTEGLRTGLPSHGQTSDAARTAEITLGATLPARALRHLFDHTAKHLDIEWRDLPAGLWDSPVSQPGGPDIPIRATPHLRALTLWQGALDLANGTNPTDIPPVLRPHLHLR